MKALDFFMREEQDGENYSLSLWPRGDSSGLNKDQTDGDGERERWAQLLELTVVWEERKAVGPHLHISSPGGRMLRG